jgi:P-type Ca2+ transporter type 2C
MTYLETGLTSAEYAISLKKHGYNEIPVKKDFRALKIILSQFSSFLIIVLIVAGSVSIFLHEIIDGLAIFGIVIINAIIGFIQEYKAENAVKALKKMVIPKAIIMRNGEEIEVPIRELVPGDLLILSEGEKLPADCEVLEAFSLKLDESMLTGESVPVNKHVGEGKEGKLFKGTLVTTGRAKARIIHTGKNTEFGKIVHLVSKEEKTRSPLAMQLDDLGKKVGLVTLGLVVILFILGYLRGISMVEMLMISVALGVSAIPEGMPIIVTLTLALGVQILARKKAIVRKMNSIETLGATTVICSDKTGTLTLNEMTVKIVNTNFKEVEIPGLGYNFKKDKVSLKTKAQQKILSICENCNNAFIGKNILGDPTEIALKILTRKAGGLKEYDVIDENVFTSDRKMMSTLHKISGKKEVHAKGAYEEIIKRCTHILKDGKVKKINKTDIAHYDTLTLEYSSRALRVLGFAYKEHKGKGKFNEKGLIFVGIIGMLDPPRKTVKASIKIAQEAGIKVKVITGDNAITAKAVGEKIGLQVHNAATGDQIDKMSDKKLIKLIHETEIFARTKPEHKYRIVDLLQKDHEVVAVTGDGVNDAPALKHADVGIAMGIKGTEATKEVADIVLKDDNFSTIVTTIKEGRRVYHNILSFIKFMLSANFDTIMAVGVLTIMGFPLPILPLQILWINIATDAFPALALGRSEASPDIMHEKPHPKKENIFKKFALFIFVAAIFQTFANLFVYFYGSGIDASLGTDIANLSLPSYARTMVFTQIVMFELFFVFMCKEEEHITFKSLTSNKSLIGAVAISFVLQLIMIYTPFMQTVFKTVPLDLTQWGVVIMLASTAFLIPGVTKLAKKVFKLK